MNANIEAFFAALSHPLRLRIVMLLNRVDELCVCELTQVMDTSQPVLSKQLAQLKNAGILTTRRQGVWMFYHINKTLPEWQKAVLAETFNGNDLMSPYKDDYQTLQLLEQQSCC